jgi:hypothetical protein
MTGLSLKVALVAKSATNSAFIDALAMNATFIALRMAVPS